MTASTVIFYILSAFAIANGFLAVTTRKIFRAAIFLLFSLIGVAGLYLWMSYEFIFAVQVIVYVGGIVVLIIFSIFLTQQAGEDMPMVLRGRQLFAGLASLAGFILAWLLVRDYPFAELRGTSSGEAPIAEIGTKMLDTGTGGMALPFEVVSILLLSAMVGCIVIALKTRKA